MKTIEQLYEPYNFSATRCYVVELKITADKYTRIEHKLPKYIRRLKGIYISISLLGNKAVGRISLNFNGQSLKALHCSIYKTAKYPFAHPYLFDEQIKLNSFMQGYFMSHGIALNEYPYTVRIYLHYQP